MLQQNQQRSSRSNKRRLCDGGDDGDDRAETDADTATDMATATAAAAAAATDSPSPAKLARVDTEPAVVRVQRWLRRKRLQRVITSRWVSKRRFHRAINTCDPVHFTPLADVEVPFVLMDHCDSSGRFYVFETLALAQWVMHNGAAVNPYTKARLTRAELRRLDVAAHALGFGISLRKRLPSLAVFAAHRADQDALVQCLKNSAFVAGDVLLNSADSSVLYVPQYIMTCPRHRHLQAAVDADDNADADTDTDTTVPYNASDGDGDGDGDDDEDEDEDDSEDDTVHYIGISGFPHIVRCRDCEKRKPPTLRPLGHGLVHAGARRVPTCCILRMLHTWSVTFASAMAQLFQAGGSEVHDALHARLKSEWAVMKAKTCSGFSGSGSGSGSSSAATATDLRRDVRAFLDTLFA